MHDSVPFPRSCHIYSSKFEEIVSNVMLSPSIFGGNISDKLLIRYQDVHKTRSKFNKFISKEISEVIFAASAC